MILERLPKMKHVDVCTLFDLLEDRDILTRRNFDVNIRLLKSSPQYRRIIEEVASYLILCLKEVKEGYTKPLGWSGSNAGIPFRMIAVWQRNTPVIMLNPEIVSFNLRKGGTIVRSNCGSLRLQKPIRVRRENEIHLRYWNIEGEVVDIPQITREEGSFTIQHEIDHTNGILITQREVV